MPVGVGELLLLIVTVTVTVILSLASELLHRTEYETKEQPKLSVHSREDVHDELQESGKLGVGQLLHGEQWGQQREDVLRCKLHAILQQQKPATRREQHRYSETGVTRLV